jgi:hypothetical protein
MGTGVGCGHAGSSVRGGVKPAIALLGKKNLPVALYFYRALPISINRHINHNEPKQPGYALIIYANQSVERQPVSSSRLDCIS